MCPVNWQKIFCSMQALPQAQKLNLSVSQHYNVKGAFYKLTQLQTNNEHVFNSSEKITPYSYASCVCLALILILCTRQCKYMLLQNNTIFVFLCSVNSSKHFSISLQSHVRKIKQTRRSKPSGTRNLRFVAGQTLGIPAYVTYLATLKFSPSFNSCGRG